MNSRALFTTVLLVVLPMVCTFAADRAAPERIQEKTIQPSAMDTDIPPTVNASGDGGDADTASGGKNNFQTARKADESPFSDIKILPSF